MCKNNVCFFDSLKAERNQAKRRSKGHITRSTHSVVQQGVHLPGRFGQP